MNPDSRTVEFRDDDGAMVTFSATQKDGRLVLRRLPKHLSVEGATPRRLENLIAFAETAMESTGEKADGDRLPGALHVQRDLPARAREYVSPRRSKRARVQEEYRSLLGAQTVEQLERELGIPHADVEPDRADTYFRSYRSPLSRAGVPGGVAQLKGR